MELLKFKDELVGHYGMMKRTIIYFPEGFTVVVDTTDMVKRFSPEAFPEKQRKTVEKLGKFGEMMGYNRRYETAMWIDSFNDKKVEDDEKFPLIILAFYDDEASAIAGHDAIVDQTRRGKLSWKSIRNDSPLVESPEVYKLLEEREKLLKEIKASNVKVKRYGRRK